MAYAPKLPGGKSVEPRGSEAGLYVSASRLRDVQRQAQLDLDLAATVTRVSGPCRPEVSIPVQVRQCWRV